MSVWLEFLTSNNFLLPSETWTTEQSGTEKRWGLIIFAIVIMIITDNLCHCDDDYHFKWNWYYFLWSSELHSSWLLMIIMEVGCCWHTGTSWGSDVRELILVPARNSEAILTREGDQHGHEEEFLSSNIFISDKRFFRARASNIFIASGWRAIYIPSGMRHFF